METNYVNVISPPQNDANNTATTTTTTTTTIATITTTTELSYTPWPESESELYLPSERRLSAKLVPTFAD
jgi:hypothetical protein